MYTQVFYVINMVFLLLEVATLVAILGENVLQKLDIWGYYKCLQCSK